MSATLTPLETDGVSPWMALRRRRTVPLDASTQVRVDANVAAYQAFYGQHGAPHSVVFRTDEDLERGRVEILEIVAAEREAYAGPLKARQAELVKKRDVDRMPYRLIAEFGKLDLEEVRACLGVAGAWYDEHDRDRAGGTLHNRDPEAWHWSRTEHFDKPDPNAVFMKIAEIVCPEAVAMIRHRVKMGSLWSAEHERSEADDEEALTHQGYAQ